MEYSEVNAKHRESIKRIEVRREGDALVVFSDGSAGVFKTPAELERHLKENHHG